MARNKNAKLHPTAWETDIEVTLDRRTRTRATFVSQEGEKVYLDRRTHDAWGSPQRLRVQRGKGTEVMRPA